MNRTCCLLIAAVTLAPLCRANVPLYFEENRGQTNAKVDYIARSSSYVLFLSGADATVKMDGRDAITMRLLGRSSKVRAVGLDQLSGRSHYPAISVGSVPHVAKVHYADVYPGIDLIYYGKERQLEYDFVVRPGADPSRIKMRFEGARNLRVDGNGNLLAGVNLKFEKPVLYQDDGGKRTPVEGGFRVDGNQVTFEVGSYRSDLPLVIDPVLSYLTYFGTSGAEELTDMFADATGSPYLVGMTDSLTFPGFAGIPVTNRNCFVTKLSPSGDKIVFSTYIPMPRAELRCRAAGNAAGDVIVYADYPTPGSMAADSTMDPVYRLKKDGSGFVWSKTVVRAVQYRVAAVRADGGAYIVAVDAASSFPYLNTPTTVERLDADAGASLWRRKLSDYGQQVLDAAVDTTGNVVFSALPFSPIATPTVSIHSALSTTPALNRSRYLVKYLADGSISWISDLGDALSPQRVAIGPGGDIWVAGQTDKTRLKVSSGAWDVRTVAADSGVSGAAVARLSPAADAVRFATLWTHESYYNPSIAVLPSGDVVLAAAVLQGQLSDPPLTADAFYRHRSGLVEGHLVKLNGTGSALRWATLFPSRITSVSPAPGEKVWVAGTSSSRLPTINPLQSSSAGGDETYLALIGNEASSCSYTVTAPSRIGPEQGIASIGVTTSLGCAWSATTDAYPMLTIAEGASSGTGVLSVNVSENLSTTSRVGPIRVAGHELFVEQRGDPCSMGTMPFLEIAAEATSYRLVVPFPPGCSWTIQSNVPWVSAPVSSGVGQVNVTLAVSPHTGTEPRTGILTVAGKTVNVRQNGKTCPMLISSTIYTAPSDGGTTAINVTTACSWRVGALPNWVQVYPLSGVGNTRVTVTALPNYSRFSRTEIVLIGSLGLGVTQEGTPASEDERFVAWLYYAAFGRLASPSEVSFHLASGRSRGELVNVFMNVPEFHNAAKFVAGLYVGILGRDAEYGGWMFQRNAMSQRGASPVGLLTNFINSAEFQLKYGNLSNAEYVRLLYRQVLGREASAAEVDFQVTHLKDRVTLAYAFLTSNEFKGRVGARLTGFLLHAILFQRGPTASEMNTRGDHITRGIPIPLIVNDMLKSPLPL